MTRRAQNFHPVFCRHYSAEIEGCAGAHGEWMHAATRREQCRNIVGRFAEPETPAQVQAAYTGLRKRSGT